jgi:hypothetical protein
VWKCCVHGNEAYIFGGLFGGEAKICLHSTGECLWSRTARWVLGDLNRRNSDRHIAKWQLKYPRDNLAYMAFRVSVPVSELRREPERPGQKKAFWIGSAPSGSTVVFFFYFNRKLDCPNLGGNN